MNNNDNDTYVLQLTLNNGVIFKRIFRAPLVRDDEISVKLNEISNEIQQALIEKTKATYGKYEPKPGVKSDGYNLTLWYKNSIIGNTRFNDAVFPPKVRFNVKVKSLLPGFIKKFTNI